jgi:hypothetical protein
VDRDALADYLAMEYDALLAEAGIALTDTDDGLGPILDAVEALVSLLVDLSPVWYQPLARYFALTRIMNRLAVNMNVSVSGDSFSLQQQFTNAKALRDEAYGMVAWLVSPLPDTSGVGDVVTIEMPYLTAYEEGDSAW